MREENSAGEGRAHPHVEIQPLLPTEAARLRALAYRCYPPFYADLWHPGAMDRYLEQSFNETHLAAELADANLVHEVAQIDHADVAFLKWHRRSDTQELANAAYLERVYVAPEVAGRRLGSLLIERVIHAAREEGRQWLWLRAMADNVKVIARYRAHGFEACGHSAIATAGVRPDRAAMVVMRCALR